LQRLWAIADDEQRVSDRLPSIASGLGLGTAAILASAMARHWLSVDLPFAFGLAAVVLAAGWGGALSAMIVVATTLPMAVVLRADHPLVTPVNIAVVTAFSVTLALFGGRLRHLRNRADAEAQRAARRETWLQTIFDTTPAAMLIAGDDGEILAMNASATRLLDPAHDTGPLRLDDLLRSPSGEPIAVPGRGVVAHADGRRVSIAVSRIALPVTSHGLQTYYIRDETEAIAAAEQLATLQSELQQLARATALGQLGSAIAHELNQPLAAAATYARVARTALSRGLDATEIDTALDGALQQIFRAAAVLKRLRDFVQRGPLHRQWLDATQVVADSVALGALAIRQVDALLDVDIAADAGDVFVDAVQIQQVILNLLANAAEAVADASVRRVVVTVRPDSADRLTITVADSGPGVAPTMTDSVFTPFRTTKPQGLGVGLAICRTIIEAHQGGIALAPASNGGAVFSFTLPRRATGMAHADAA